MTHAVISRPLQSRFLDIPQAPLAYWLRERFFELLAGKTLGDVADVRQGLATGNDGDLRDVGGVEVLFCEP